MSERHSTKKLDLNSSAVDAATTTTITNRRRFFGHVVLAGAASAVLAACGGGSDPLEPTGSSSDDKFDLKSAFNRLKDGMRSGDVVALVGAEPNTTSTSTTHIWTDDDGERLLVTFTQEGVVNGAKYNSNDSAELEWVAGNV
ncbi:hypothetical protein [Hydrogenophaga sp. 5NK40-0174]|uniref:hypothetical protein n=1 Tax=Hydrogenophaga sp. 5NK40-0174 TaxID=3127649 RepID=UPI0031069094